jgi:hypothetical protein
MAATVARFMEPDQRQGAISSIGEPCPVFRRRPREETGHASSAERCRGSLGLFR